MAALRSRQRRCVPRSHRRTAAPAPFCCCHDKQGNKMSVHRPPRHDRRRTPAVAVRQAPSAQRRRMLSASAAGALMALIDPAVRAGAWAAGSDAPEKTEVKVGFIPLTDCASVVIASVIDFDEKYGIKLVPGKEAASAGERDKLV